MTLKIFPLFLLLALSACAAVTRHHVTLQPAAAPETVSATQGITFSLDTGVRRKIKADSKWRYVGDIKNGKVYKPVDDVFSIEGTQQYEAYLVISGGKIVGFYLPASSNFSPLSNQVLFP